jgi:hypothetical protein
MKTMSLLLTLLAVLGLTACQPRGSSGGTGASGPVGVPSPTSPGTPTPAGPTPGGGTGAGGLGGADPVGGGNGVEGLMIEDFRVYVSDTEGNKQPGQKVFGDAYKRLDQKIFKKLILKFPKLAADLKFVANHKRWYVIPTELKSLPSGRIGVSFKTDQYGLQTPTEIYIDLRFFRDMSEAAQETLILHEMVMGVRLLEFANPLETCLVNIEVMTFSPELEKPYREKREACFAKNKTWANLGSTLNMQKPYQLADSDYPFIRDMTSTLANQIDACNPQELEVWMEVNNFRKYPSPEQPAK